MMQFDDFTLNMISKITSTYAAVAIVFGCITNSVLILMIVKCKELHTRSGFIMLVSLFSQVICLLSEISHVYTLMIKQTMHSDTCLLTLFPIYFFSQFQLAVLATLVFDVILATLNPVRIYLTVVLTPAFVYATIMAILTSFNLVNKVLPECNVMIMLNDEFAKNEMIVSTFLNIFTLCEYMVLMYILNTKKSSVSSCLNQVIRSLKVMVFVFITCVFLVHFLSPMFYIYFEEPKTLACLQSSLIVLVVTQYALNFFICTYRSKIYRTAFFELFSLNGQVVVKPISVMSMTVY